MEKIKRILGEYSGINPDLITTDLSFEDDLYLNEDDILEILDEIEEYFQIEFEDKEVSLIYVADLITLVKTLI